MARKGSQLKRFKESLSAVTQGKHAVRKKRTLSEKDPERKEKLRHIEQQFNAFDTKFTRSKHEVFGRKIKGKTGKPALTRELGEEKRKAALLKQRQQRNKVGGVIDRRFGEDDPDMDPEERMLERFALEKKKRSRNMSLYNLEDNAQLTHFGQSLAEIDDYEEDLIGVSDDDGDLKEDVVRQEHFGGNFDGDDSDDNTKNGDPERVKTKSEVMQEVIAKSKMYKHERQKQHEEDLDEIEDLDAELGEIQGLLHNIGPLSRTQPTYMKEMRSYDAALREMVHDKRSKPSERTKTEEEIAQEEKERLETLERERVRRMRGEEVESVEESSSKKRGVRREGDDLDDDFVPHKAEEDLYGFGKGALADVSDQESGDEDEDNNDDEDEDGGGGDEEHGSSTNEEGAGSDDDDFDLAAYFTDEEANGVLDENGAESETASDVQLVPATKRLRLAESSSNTKELAYTYPCPTSFDELLTIVHDIPAESIPIVIERIETLYSIKLRAENREKLETFTPLVLRLMLHLVSEDLLSFNNCLAIISRLHVLATQFPSALTQEVFTTIEDGRKRLLKSFNTAKHDFPAPQDLVLFYTIGQIYETSELFHTIVNATTLFMGQILSQMRVRSIQEVARGLFVCSMFLQYQNLAKRLCPEVVQFINHSLLQLIPSKSKDLPENRVDIGATELLSRLAKDKSPGAGSKVPFTSLYGKNIDEAQLFRQIINTALNLVDISSELWKQSVTFSELFQETSEILQSISTSDLPSDLITSIDTVKSALAQRLKLSLGSRAALTLQAHKPIPIPSYLPRYSMSYSLDSKNDPDHERSNLGKLRAQHRREKKSVIRELRKEARTEAVVKSDEGRRRDKAYAEKMRIATGIMKGGNSGIGKWERDQKRKRR